jgi:hypothetical protein
MTKAPNTPVLKNVLCTIPPRWSFEPNTPYPLPKTPSFFAPNTQTSFTPDTPCPLPRNPPPAVRTPLVPCRKHQEVGTFVICPLSGRTDYLTNTPPPVSRPARWRGSVTTNLIFFSTQYKEISRHDVPCCVHSLNIENLFL